MVGKGTLRGAFSVYHAFKPLVTLFVSDNLND